MKNSLFIENPWVLKNHTRYQKRNILNLKNNIVPSTIVYLPTLGEIFVTFQVRLVSSGGMIRYLKVNIHQCEVKYVTSEIRYLKGTNCYFCRKIRYLGGKIAYLCGKFHYLKEKIRYLKGKNRYLFGQIRYLRGIIRCLCG